MAEDKKKKEIDAHNAAIRRAVQKAKADTARGDKGGKKK
jgi:hypothetical protein